MKRGILFTFYVCASCERPLEWKWNLKNLPFCTVCFNYLIATQQDIEGVISLFSSHGVSHKILRHWKKHPHTFLEEEIFHRAQPALDRVIQLHALRPWHGIVPIPQSHERAFALGGGPARRIARRLSKKLNLGIFELLEKKHDRGLRQAEKSYHERLESTIRYQIPTNQTIDWGGKRVLLIDDFMTTGQTIQSAQNTLRDCGLAQIDILILGHRPHFFNSDAELIT